jgi:predicted flap endonuclease-1-like 5' DNA nuclease
VNGLTLLAMIALAIGVVVAYRAGLARGRREAPSRPSHPFAAVAATSGPATPPLQPPPPPGDLPPAAATAAADSSLEAERERLVRAYEAENVALSRKIATADAERCQLRAFAEDRHALLGAIADARAETARYRQLVVDVEDNAPARFLGGPGSPDDLKLIVGVGPMLERMLYQLGVTTYRQIARWSEHEIDEYDRRLPEFPGRIRRDAWVTQAKALHHSKYGTAP